MFALMFGVQQQRFHLELGNILSLSLMITRNMCGFTCCKVKIRC